MKPLLMIVIAAACIAGTPAFAQPLTFRGLGANSTRAEVLKAFPRAKIANYCREGETVTRDASGLTLCAQLSVENYELDNVSFDVSIMFNPNGTLRYISLIKSYGAARSDVGRVPVSIIESTFSSLAELLSSKYGPAVIDSPGAKANIILGLKNAREFEWQPGRGTKWQAGGDRIALKSDADESRTTPGLFRGRIQVFYTFARRDEFKNF